LRFDLPLAFGDADEFADAGPLRIIKDNRGFIVGPKVDLLDQRKTTLRINRESTRRAEAPWTKLVVGLLEKLAKALGGSCVPGLFKLLSEECRIVPYTLDIETKGSVYDTEYLAHVTIIVAHETIISFHETIVKSRPPQICA